MPRCNCEGGKCSCLVLPGVGVTIEGSGSATNPYIVSADPMLGARLRVADTATVDLSAVGNGTDDDPLVLSAIATVAMDDLTNVTAPAPAVGDTLSWNGQEWITGPPPVVPPGAVNVGAGLVGNGSVETPVAAAVSGVWGTPPLDVHGDDSTVGLAIYVDANGQLRADPRDTSGPVSWDEIVGRPSAFPTTWDTVTGKPTLWPVVASTPPATTMASGWSLVWVQAHNRGGVATVSARVRRTGSAINAPSDGNINNTLVMRLTSELLRPYHYGSLTTTTTGPAILGHINSEGQISLASTVPNITLSTGSEYILTGTWVTRGN